MGNRKGRPFSNIEQCDVLTDSCLQTIDVRGATDSMDTVFEKCWKTKDDQNTVERYNRSMQQNEILTDTRNN